MSVRSGASTRSTEPASGTLDHRDPCSLGSVAGLACGLAGYNVANKAATIYAGYLETDDERKRSLLKQVAWPGKISRQGDRQLRLVMRQPAAGQFDQLAMVLGCPLQAIRCIRIGRLALGKLPEGQWRYLQEWERF